MNVARQGAKQLALPAAMILFAVALWAGWMGRTLGLVVMMLFLVVLAFRLGRLSATIWPINPSEPK